ncbi:uncharacterized protein KD926_000802 [Aspergillus affinis]|uniref:uncharacterized protein n=1 Tax=Aspergillus affinis TaxID=1070780 RepID=UPI0022FE035B|nr:dual specificity protein phosphatase 5 [Aspergillus affinis]KAI9037154.1 dual specificity protein phosphatase 5 [Aspergillus affinis]
MSETAAKANSDEESQLKWKMAFTARMRQIVPGLVPGNVEASYKREMLLELHSTAIVSLTDARWCVDSSTQDLLCHMSDICDFIDGMTSPALSSLFHLPLEHQNQATVESNDAPPEAVLVHCDLGISRSPTIIIAYLMRKLTLKQADVWKFVHSKQKVKPSANLTRQLQVWEETGYEVWEDENRTVPKALYKAFLEHRAAVLKSKRLTGDEPLAPLSLV